MTVKEYAKKHRSTILDMMTPSGFLTISANDLLTVDEVRTNPGCPDCDMTIESAEILEMTIINVRTNNNTAAMLVE